MSIALADPLALRTHGRSLEIADPDTRRLHPSGTQKPWLAVTHSVALRTRVEQSRAHAIGRSLRGDDVAGFTFVAALLGREQVARSRLRTTSPAALISFDCRRGLAAKTYTAVRADIAAAVPLAGRLARLLVLKATESRRAVGGTVTELPFREPFVRITGTTDGGAAHEDTGLAVLATCTVNGVTITGAEGDHVAAIWPEHGAVVGRRAVGASIRRWQLPERALTFDAAQSRGPSKEQDTPPRGTKSKQTNQSKSQVRGTQIGTSLNFGAQPGEPPGLPKRIRPHA